MIIVIEIIRINWFRNFRFVNWFWRKYLKGKKKGIIYKKKFLILLFKGVKIGGKMLNNEMG